MVRDAYSAGGHMQQADAAAAAQALDVRGNTANLTQELAQLLAQSIAQGQSGKRPPGAAATGSELASLAALVSASQSQRSQPYKDGLSSLSYARPAHSPVPAPMPAAPSLLVTEPQHDDEPMPIPSTWRQPTLSDDDRWYRQQLGAAALGLIAGLVVVVPAVLWLSGYLGGPQAKAARPQTADQQPTFRMADVKQVPVNVPVKVHVAASADPRPVKVEQPPPVVERAAAVAIPPPRVEPVRSRADDLLAQAKRRIDSGDIPGARAILQAAETDASGPMMFMLAETYDPSMLAIWQTSGVTANPQRARALYQKARDLGDGRAQQRLDWLK